MSTTLTKTSATFELYRDGKLATWALYSPKVGDVAMPLWQAMSDGYGKKVTILSPTKEVALKKIEEYSKKTERKISVVEADSVYTYGVYGLLGGGLVTAIGYLTKFPKVGRAGGIVAAVGLTAAAAGKVFSPKKVEGNDQIVLDLGLGT